MKKRGRKCSKTDYRLEEHANYYFALDGWNLVFTYEEINQFDQMWNEGKHLSDIAKALNRENDEITILVIDRIHKNKIKKREGGYKGVC